MAARVTRKEVAETSWRMGICLLAVERSGLHRARGYSSAVQYAVMELKLDGHKSGELLRAARELEALPAISEAYRTGQLCWSKVQELTRVVCPQTESEWLDFALNHGLEDLRPEVTASPRQWRQRALAANRAAVAATTALLPEATEAATTGPLTPEGANLPRPGRARRGADLPAAPETGSADLPGGASPAQVPPSANLPGEAPRSEGATLPGAASDNRPAADLPRPGGGPRLIRHTLYFTPDQWAEFEQGVAQVRSRLGKRATKEAVALEMARASADGACSRTRARHLVVVHVDGETGQGWYETHRGRLPASAVIIEENLRNRTSPKQPSDPKMEHDPQGRKQVPTATLRALHARSGGRCEVPGCGRGSPLHVHHRRPVSEGGGNDLDGLEIRCKDCHALGHEKDFEHKPAWRRARAARRSRASPAG